MTTHIDSISYKCNQGAELTTLEKEGNSFIIRKQNSKRSNTIVYFNRIDKHLKYHKNKDKYTLIIPLIEGENVIYHDETIYKDLNKIDFDNLVKFFLDNFETVTGTFCKIKTRLPLHKIGEY